MSYFKPMLRSNLTYVIIIGIIVLAASLVIFQAGILVGYRKARFTYSMGERYYKNFEGSTEKITRSSGSVLDLKDLPGGHGAVGKILGVNLPYVVISGQDNIEKVIAIATSTLIIKFRDSASTTDLTVDANIAVIGQPDGDGHIQAKLIRILPQE